MSEYDGSHVEKVDTRVEDEIKEYRNRLMSTGHYEDDDADIMTEEYRNLRTDLGIKHPSDSELEAQYGRRYKEFYQKDALDAYHRRFEGGLDNATVGGMGVDPLLGRSGSEENEFYDETFSAEERDESEGQEEEQSGRRRSRK